MQPGDGLEEVVAGMRVAALLGMPLTIAGQPVFIPSSVADRLQGRRVESEPMSTNHESLAVWDLARRCAFLMQLAGDRIGELGIAGGALPEPPQPAPAPIREAPKYAPAPPPRIDVVKQPDGTLRVGNDYEVRTCDGRAWFCIFLPKNLLMSWHTSQEHALAWARSEIENRKDNR